MYLKLTNILGSNGNIDYKGIDISKIVNGTQRYANDFSFCIFETGEVVTERQDVKVITESQYNELVLALNQDEPLSEMEILKQQDEKLLAKIIEFEQTIDSILTEVLPSLLGE